MSKCCRGSIFLVENVIFGIADPDLSFNVQLLWGYDVLRVVYRSDYDCRSVIGEKKNRFKSRVRARIMELWNTDIGHVVYS